MIFDTNRYGFGVIGDNLVVMRAEDRCLTTDAWLLSLGLDYSEIKGYITRDRIQFFDGDYGTSPDVTTDMVNAALEVFTELYDATDLEADRVPVYNGLTKGKEGDQWPPKLEYSRLKNRWVPA